MQSPPEDIFVQGDTCELQYQLFVDKRNNIYWNLTDNEIRFQLDVSPTPIYKATANVTGGADAQITIVNAVQGIFLIIITSEESKDLSLQDYTFTIKVTTPSGKNYTVHQAHLRIINNAISWTDEPV
jgi:hypothetical protein